MFSVPRSSSCRRRSVLVCSLFSLCALVLATSSRADVTMTEKTVSSGMAGFGAGVTEATHVIAGDKSRTDETFTYTGRGKTFIGGEPRSTSEIMRLDRDLVWDLDHAKQEYTELSFAEMQARAQLAMQNAEASRQKEKAQGVEMDYKVDVDRTGKKETVNGFPAEEFIVTLSATPKSKTDGKQVASYSMKLDEWLSSAVPGQEEVMAFQKRLALKLGMDPSVQRMGQMMTAQYGDGLRELGEKMKDLKGYPVRTIMTVGALLSPEQQAQMDKAQADAKKAQADAKARRDSGEKGEDVQGAAQAGASVSKGDVKGGIGGFFAQKLARAAQKKAEGAAENAEPAGGAGGLAMTVTMDVLSVSDAPATGARFDVPAGYTKVVPKEQGKSKH
jgi:hypothetical protein